MTSDLLVSFQSSCSFKHVHPLEYCIWAIPFTYFKHGAHKVPVSFLRIVINKQIHLIHTDIFCDIACTYAQSPEEESVIRFFIKLADHRNRNGLQIICQ